MTDIQTTVFTIGHSTLPYEQFLALLRGAGVTAVADVRSAPYSRHQPHFNRDILSADLKAEGIAYVFMGEELGGRPKGAGFYCEGVADYERMAQAPAFKAGLARVIDGAGRHRIALMCSEQDPLDCHRCLLVGRSLNKEGVTVRHVLPTGDLKDQSEIEAELLHAAGLDGLDLFASPQERLVLAYRRRATKVAFAGAPATAAE